MTLRIENATSRRSEDQFLSLSGFLRGHQPSPPEFSPLFLAFLWHSTCPKIDDLLQVFPQIHLGILMVLAGQQLNNLKTSLELRYADFGARYT